MMKPISRAAFQDRPRGILTHELPLAHELRRQARRFVFLVLTVLLGSSSVLYAATASWNANPESDIAGYVLSYGTSPGVHPTTVNVANVTTWLVTSRAGPPLLMSRAFQRKASGHQRNSYRLFAAHFLQTRKYSSQP